ncbi:MAG: hypothetical protein OEY70_20115, partial [Acidimicrobiia bacterium]|nr:hypothetical protein [Acidimicrobiia bacterium]
EDPEALTRSVHHVLAHPQLFLNTTSDSRLLPVVFQAAADHDGSAPDPVDLDADLVAAEAAPIFDGGALERI